METIDYAVLFGYFAGMAAIGVWAMKRVKGQEDYFMGGRRFGKLFQTFAAFGAARIRRSGQHRRGPSPMG